MDSQAIETNWEMPPRKRIRCTNPEHNHDLEDRIAERTKQARLTLHEDGHDHIQVDLAVPIPVLASSNGNNNASKVIPKTVAPFMAQHIPAHYAPLSKQPHTSSTPILESDMNSKFCYRHRPDMLCRRQADEPSMDLLQRNLETLSENDKLGIVQVWNLFSAAPSKHRDLMLQGILTQCCFPQLSFLSANVQKLIKIDFLSALPAEISFRILSSLDTISLCQAAQVSRRWRSLADDDVVWHRMCEQHIDRKCTKCGWGLPLMDRKRLRASKRQMQLRAAGKGSTDTPSTNATLSETSESVAGLHLHHEDSERSSSGSNSELPRRSKEDLREKRTQQWKHVYRDRFCIGKNWKHGNCGVRILKSHTNGVQCLQLRGKILATGSYDCTIKIWDLDKGTVLRTLTGHTMGVRCLQFDSTKLISGSMDKTIKVWNWRTGELLNTYSQHSEGVIGLHFVFGLPNLLVSASADRTIRVWDFEARTTHALHGHSDWVNSVKIDEHSRTVFSVSDDFTVKLWDLDTKKCIRTYDGHVAHVQQIVLLDRNFDAEDSAHTSWEGLQSGPSSPQSIRTTPSSNRAAQLRSPSPTMTFANLSCSRKFDVFDETFPKCGDRLPPPRYFLTSALDNTIRMWETNTGRCVRTFFGHVEGVWALAADSLRIVSGAEDRMLKIWDPKDGRCERTFTGHAGPVTCVDLGDSKMCSGSEDGEVRVYCFEDCPGHSKQMSPEMQMG